jgi:hypothetical protein
MKGRQELVRRMSSGKKPKAKVTRGKRPPAKPAKSKAMVPLPGSWER